MHRDSRFPIPVLLAIAVAVPAAARAQETASDTLLPVEHYLDWEQVADPQLSPDGMQVVYTRRYVNKIEDKWESALWIMSADGSKNRFLVKGSGARWSPTGRGSSTSPTGSPKGRRCSCAGWMPKGRPRRSPTSPRRHPTRSGRPTAK